MLILLSPAKNLQSDGQVSKFPATTPQYLSEAEYLVAKLKKKSAKQLSTLMSISPDLAGLNHERFQQWTSGVTSAETTQAALMFKGEVYIGLGAHDWSKKDAAWAQEHVRILSGLYGILRPLDAAKPYRLEMGTRLTVTPKKTSLYKYWDDLLKDHLQRELDDQGSEVIINLASNEYAKAARLPKMNARVITPQFKDYRKGEYKMLMVFAKRARGMMADFAVRERLSDPEQLKSYDRDGYTFNAALSEGDDWVFTREEK